MGEWSWKKDKRFGSARFSTAADIKAAGLFYRTEQSLYLGELQGKNLHYDGDGGALLVAGARSGKMRDVLAYNICSGMCAELNLIILDPRGELAAISQDQTADRKHCFYVNPLGLHGLPHHSIDPLSFLKRPSPTLVSDIKVMMETIQPLSGAAQSSFFELNSRRFLEAIALALVMLNGTLSFIDLYRIVTSILAAGDEWQAFAFEMRNSGIEECRAVEAEIESGHKDSSGGFKGIIGEMQKSLSALSDPLLRDALSPPHDFDLEVLLDPEQPVQIYLMVPPELISTWAVCIKCIFASAMIRRTRVPSAPRQTWILDECAQLKGFDLVTKMFTFAAGSGCKPYAVFQDVSQMDALGPGARRSILSSAAVQSYFGVRDLESAKHVSEMLGIETLDYVDVLQDGRRAQEAGGLAASLLAGRGNGTDMQRLEQLMFEAREPAKLRRALQTADEVLHMASDHQFIFTDNLPGPIYAERRPYWKSPAMAGRYHPNPFHPPLDRVAVQTRWGQRWRPVIHEPVPDEFKDYPQYRDGMWSRIGD